MQKPEPPLQYLKGVGPKRSEALSEIGIRSIRDLFYYFPRGYLDRSQRVNIADLKKHASAGEPVTVFAEVFRQEARRTRRSNRLIFFLTVQDETGSMSCVWFEGYRWLKDAFEIGEFLAISAVPTLDKFGRPQFVHPEFDRLQSAEDDEPDWGKLFNTGGIIPKYRSSAELEKVGLDSRGFRRILRNAVNRNLDLLEESLPDEIRRKRELLDQRAAIRAIHFPADRNELQSAERRLKYEELFFFQLMLALRKRIRRQEPRGFAYTSEDTLARDVTASLPFELTGAQKRVLREITADLTSPFPMNRLLQGDVGSGKTVVALHAALFAVGNGCQAAFMAPTEILAEQHSRTISSILKNTQVTVRLLIGGQKKKLRDEVLEDIRSGGAQIVVGTHALAEEKVEFAKLGLVIVDEQHRFGVLQRATLREKGGNPDVLVMTATPIPRTLAMTLYGDLDVSVIDELPSGRVPIRTALRSEQQKPRVYEFVKEEIARGRQAYIVFPLVEESEKVDLKAATAEYEHLQRDVFPRLHLGLLHGRMKTEEKDAVLRNFADGKTHILISTTVIEVGIDVPNATVMLIENAERFGLAQLHQLRGRVGRGADQSYCILIANYGWFDAHARGTGPVELREEKQNAKSRLETMVATTDGFAVAEADLKLRGPGEFFGTRQSGVPEFRIAHLVDDAEMVARARDDAFALLQEDPHLRNESHACIRTYFESVYRDLLELGKIG